MNLYGNTKCVKLTLTIINKIARHKTKKLPKCLSLNKNVNMPNKQICTTPIISLNLYANK